MSQQHPAETMELSDRILTAAASLFERIGIRSVSMDDLSRSLGMSKKTIYQCFRDKDEIVTKYCHYHRQKQIDALNSIYENSPSALHELVAMTKHMREMVAKLNPGMLYELSKYHPNGYHVFLEHKHKDILPMISRSIQRGVNEGVFRSDLNVAIIARLRMEEVQLAFNPDVYPPDQFKIVEVQEQLLSHFLNGVLTPEGKKAYEALKAASLGDSNQNYIPTGIPNY